jgi:succinate dehydrogenase / fumarate reductase membrane anchor subunit
MRESTIMKIHYGTALAAVALVAVHILMRLTQGFAESLEYESVLANYKFVPYAIMLELILVLLSVHGFNGLRVILLELKQGRIYEKAVSYGIVNSMNFLSPSCSGLNLAIRSVVDFVEERGVDACSSAILGTCVIYIIPMLTIIIVREP